MSDTNFGTWTAEASPLTIEYSLVVIEEIRHEVAEGFQKLSRGGIEVGGLLYGVHDAQTVRIMAIRPAACEHAGGPAFRLSEKDRAALRDQMRQAQEDPRLDGLVCVGWYVSHTRTEISLAESDQEIFSSFFSQPWQVTLVVRPSRGGNMRAGFFVREPGGTINAQSHLEFSFPDRLAGVFDRGERPPRPPADRERSGLERERSGLERPTAEGPTAERRRSPRFAQPLAVSEQATAAAASTNSNSSKTNSFHTTSLFGVPAPAPESGDYPGTDARPDLLPKANSAKKWFWLAAALIVVALLAVGGARFLSLDGKSQTIALSVLEREGQLEIGWNRQAAPVSKAVGATLEITDGAQTKRVPLTPGDLALGKFSYKRDTGDIQVRMIVDAPDGKKVQEASRFLGPPPSQGNAEELKTLQQRRDDLEAEVTRLKQSNDQQAQRIQQLERTLKILQTRPGVN